LSFSGLPLLSRVLQKHYHNILSLCGERFSDRNGGLMILPFVFAYRTISAVVCGPPLF
jgi:hypothetical protein